MTYGVWSYGWHLNTYLPNIRRSTDRRPVRCMWQFLFSMSRRDMGEIAVFVFNLFAVLSGQLRASAALPTGK